MTDLKDLAPENYPAPALDVEARALVDRFEELFCGASPPDAPLSPQPAPDQFTIEFPDDGPPGTGLAAASTQAPHRRRELVLAPAENRPLTDGKPAGLRGQAFELPRVVVAAESGAAVPLSGKREHPGLSGGMHSRRKSTGIFVGIAVALVIGLGAGYIAGKRTQIAASETKADSLPGTGATLRFDYELTAPSKSAKKRNPVR